MKLEDLFYIHTEILGYIPDYLIREYEKEDENNSLLFIVLLYSRYKNGRKIFEIFKNKCIANDKINLFVEYSRIKGRRIKEFEPYIIEKGIEFAYEYAKDVIGDRFPEAESFIGKDSGYAYNYAKNILKGKRFRPPNTEFNAEPYIARNPKWAYDYAYDIIKGRFPEAEPFIGKETYYAYIYVRDILKGKRFRPPNTKFNAEPYIAQDPELAYYYAMYTINGEFPEAEPFIGKDPYYAYLYAKDILKGKRFRPPNTKFNAEPYIARNLKWACDYAYDVIKGRFPEIEKEIYNSFYKKYYENVILKPLGLTWKDIGYE